MHEVPGIGWMTKPVTWQDWLLGAATVAGIAALIWLLLFLSSTD